MTTLFSGAENFTQANRTLRIYTPLGEDILLLYKLEAWESFSQPYSYSIDMLSRRDDIQASEILSELVTVTIDTTNSAPRFFNGHVVSFEFTGFQEKGLYGYRAEVVPWLWFLSKSSNCRVFQNQSVTEILESVFTGLGFSDYTLSRLSGNYPKLDYCVQYRETDLNFISRLLEQEGIFYYFLHEHDKHTLVLADNNSAYLPLDRKPIEYRPGAWKGDFISQWRHRFRFFSGRWSQSDFDFEKFDHSLVTKSATVVTAAKSADYEQYDYPGYYKETDRGRILTNLKMEREENNHDTVTGTSSIQTLEPGKIFVFHSDDCPRDHKKKFVVTRLHHRIFDNSYVGSQNSTDEKAAADEGYQNEFECIPDTVTFRPPLKTPKPKIEGVQTAVVVGKAGDEIYTDNYGRIKLQFHWDRYGSKNETSSCWVRVATQWAGKKWGTLAIPRVGQEVVVTFVDGDPDQPLVIGSVYNSAHKPPFNLPGAKTQSGIKSNSSKGGGNYNEISFEDKAGAERITIHAAKDFNFNVGNNLGGSTTGNASTSVDGNSSDSVGGDQSLSVGGNQTLNVTGTQTVSVTGNRTANYSGNETFTVGGNQEQTITGDQSVTVTNQTHNVSATHTVNAGNQTFSVDSAQTFSASNQTFSISGKQNFQAGSQEFSVDGKASISASEIALSAASKITLSVGGSVITLDAGKIEITLGASSVTVDPTGVTVTGPMVKLN